MREVLDKSSPLARVLLVIAALFLIVTCVSLCKRAWRGDTDFSVFYRAGQSVAAGAGSEIYAERDRPTGWYNCIPPIGVTVFLGLASFHRVTAAILWAVANLAMLAVCVVALKHIYRKLTTERIHYDSTLPFAIVMLAVFGGVCIQTGQTSVLFVTCWLGYVWASSENKRAWAGFLLSVPAALKLYPLVFGLVPLLRKRFGEASWGIVWIFVLTLLIPAIVFREQFVEMTQAFFRYQVLDPEGRVMTAANPTAVSNQGLDAVLLRYFSYVPTFHDVAVGFPHFGFSQESVLAIANGLRVLIVGVTFLASLGIVRRGNVEPPLLLMALWCAALYMILPGAKGRYAIYALPALLVMMAAAHRAFSQKEVEYGRKLVACTVVACALLLQMVPDYWLRYGIGYVAPLILWAFTLREALAPEPSARRTGEDHASGRERATNVF